MHHHRNTPLIYKGVKKNPKSDTDISQCAKFPSNYTSNPNLIGSIFLDSSYGIPIILQEDTKGGHCARFSHKEGNRPGEYRLTSSEEEDYSKKQKFWLFNIRNINWGTNSSVEVIMPKKSPWLLKSTNTRGNGEITADSCSNTSDSTVSNGLVEVSKTEGKVKSVGFDNVISNKTILTGSSMNAIYLHNGSVSYHLNERW